MVATDRLICIWDYYRSGSIWVELNSIWIIYSLLGRIITCILSFLDVIQPGLHGVKIRQSDCYDVCHTVVMPKFATGSRNSDGNTNSTSDYGILACWAWYIGISNHMASSTD